MPFRCVFGCNHGNSLHHFPSPIKFPERFRVWREAVGLQASSLPDSEIKGRLRVCDLHFIDEHRVRNNRLSALAVPCRNLPGPFDVKIEINSGCDASKEVPPDDGGLNHDDTDVDLSINEVITQPRPEDNTPDGTRNKSSAIDGLLKPSTPIIPNTLNVTSCPTVSKHDYFLNQGEKNDSKHKYEYKPDMGAYYHNQWLLQRKKLRYQGILLSRLRRKIRVLRKSTEILRMSDERAWKRVTRNMTGPAKLFLSMQMKSKRWNKYTTEEKALVISMYKKSPECYNVLCDYFNLPSIAKLSDSTLKIGEIS